MDNEAQELSRIQIRSEEVEAILSYIPRWIIRWGITVLLLVFVMLIAMAAWIEYPDIVYGRTELTTETLPTSVLTPSNGKISLLKVANEETVSFNDLLAVIDNPTQFEAYQQLKEKMKKWSQLTSKQFHSIDAVSIPKLGELQSFYAELQESINEYQDFRQLDVKGEDVEALKKQQKSLKDLQQKMNGQLETAEANLKLAQEDVTLHEKLLKEGLTSKRQVEQLKSVRLEKEAVKKSLLRQQESYNSDIAALETRIVNFKTGNQQQKQQLIRAIRSNIDRLQGALKVWEANYLIKAPVEGKVNLPPNAQKQQYLQTNDELLTIVPENRGDTIAIIYLSPTNLGKVEEGQSVNIKLDSHPHAKYGLLKGKMGKIGTIPRDGLYRTPIRLTNGTVSNFNQKLGFTQGVTGTAEIITKDATVMQRILEQFIELTR